MQQQSNILAIGDSLTKGYYNSGFSYHPYASRLSSLLKSYHVEPYGVNGERTGEMKVRLDEIYNLYSDDTFQGVIVIGGTNDLAFCSSDLIIENLIAMYEKCIGLKNVKFVVACSIPSSTIDGRFNERSSMIQGYLKNKAQVNQAIGDYVEKSGNSKLIFVDLMEELNFCKCNDEERNNYWDDTLHFTPQGYDRIADILYEKLIKSNLL